MKTFMRCLNLLLWYSLWLPAPSISQDTLKIFRFPPIDQVDVIVNARVTAAQGKLQYEYEIKSLPTSKQDTWVFDIPFQLQPSQIKAPEGWDADAGGGVPRITWGSRDSIYNIRPNQVLSGFSYYSEGLPSITVMYIRGWAEPPELTFEPDSTVGGDALEDSKKVLTIAATKPPSPFVAIAFLDTLLSYARQSLSLGWITSKAIADKYTGYFTTSRSQVKQRNIPAARSTLETVLQQADQDSSASLTSEAYALLRYNTEYLLQQLAEQAQVTIDDLIRMKHEAEANGWVGDKNFVKELDNHLENAREHHHKGGSTNAYKEVEQFQQKVNKEYERTVENQKKNKTRDKRFVTVEGWNLLYPNAQKVLDSLTRKKK